MFGLSSLYFKLAGIVLVLAGFAYSYVWTYHQGQTNGEASSIERNAKAMLEFQRQSALNESILREKELREARQIADQENKNNQIRISELKKLNDTLKNQAPAAAIVPADVIKLLNSASGDAPTD